MRIQISTLALMICLTQSTVWAQEETPAVPVAPDAPMTQSFNRSYGMASSPRSPLATWQNGSMSELSKAMKLLKDAVGDEDREKAIGQLRSALDDQYDKSLENYAEYLDKLEDKIKTLREQVTKRRSAKNELVELKLKMMVNEADGLGWPENQPGGFFMNHGSGVFSNSQSGNLYFPRGGGAPVSDAPAALELPRVSGQSGK